MTHGIMTFRLAWLALSLALAVWAGAQEGKEVVTTGTAFVIHADGYLLTCAHVVNYADKVTVTLGGKTYDAAVLSTDDYRDLAVLQITATNLTPLPLVNSNRVQQGEEVRACGYPLAGLVGKDLKVTRGTLSGITTLGTQKSFQIDAPINAGNSGGPLINERGEVIGVVNAKMVENGVEGTGFAVPINYARTLLRGEFIDLEETEAKIERAKLDGPALVKSVTPALALVTVTSTEYAEGEAEFPILDKLQVKKFELVDDDGNVLVSMNRDDEDGEPMVYIKSPKSQAGIGLYTMKSGPSVLFVDTEQRVRMAMGVENNTADITLYGEKEKRAITLSSELKGDARIDLFDLNNVNLATLGVTGESEPSFAIWDTKGKLLWSAP